MTSVRICSVDLAQMLLRQYFNGGTADALLNPSLLENAHILELG